MKDDLRKWFLWAAQIYQKPLTGLVIKGPSKANQDAIKVDLITRFQIGPDGRLIKLSAKEPDTRLLPSHHPHTTILT